MEPHKKTPVQLTAVAGVTYQRKFIIKTFFKTIGILFLVLIVLLVCAGGWTGYKSSGYEKTAIPFMEKAIPEISKWDSDIMKSYMAPETMSEVSDAEFSKMVKILSKMGALISIDEPMFQSVSSSTTSKYGAMTAVTYKVKAIYENGDATLNIVLKESGDSFKFFRFNVDSLALFN